MTNTIDKVAAEPAEQEPAGAIDESRGEQRQRLRTADDREKPPQRRLTESTRSSLAIRQRADYR
jgi:hypothetical protein